MMGFFSGNYKEIINKCAKCTSLKLAVTQVLINGQ